MNNNQNNNRPVKYTEAEAELDIRRTTDLWQVLLDDVRLAKHEMVRDYENQHLRGCRQRTLVRAVFSLIEGTCYGLRSMCLKANADVPNTANLDAATVLELSEKTAKGKDHFLPFEDSIELSFRSICTVMKWNFVLDQNQAGYAALLRSKKVRNRLMHPKDVDEITLGQTEVMDALEACDWFGREMNRWKASGLASAVATS